MSLLTAVTFDYRLKGGSTRNGLYVIDPIEKPQNDWLSDPERDFNRLMQSLTKNPHLENGSVTIAWDDGVKATLPVPPSAGAKDIVTVGDLVQRIAELMIGDDGDEMIFPEDNQMLLIAERVGRLEAAKQKTGKSPSSGPRP